MYVLNTATSLIDGNWHHFAQVYTRSADGTTDTWSTYVDYVHVTTTNFDTSTSDFSSDFNLDIGSTFISAPSGGGPTQSVTWFLDESRYSNNALGADDFLRVVPEPASGLLIALGGLGLLIARRRV